MNKFKSLLLFCMGFAFVALPLSNQGFCNGDPVLVTSFADCTADVAVSDMCNGAGTNSTVTLTISNSTGDAATATATDGTDTYSGSINTSNGDIILVNDNAMGDDPADGATLTITVTISGGNCTTANVAVPDYTITCPVAGCQNCFAGNAMIQDANGVAEGGEICGTTTETFEVGGELTCNGTVGSAALPNRTMVHEFGTSAEYSGGFEVFLGSEFTSTNAPISCVPLVEDNHDTRFSANPTADMQVKIAPNPVTNIAQIQYNIAEEGRVLVSVFDLKGNRVAVIANGTQMTGTHTVDFDASNLAGGFYYLTVQTASTQVTERMVIVK